LLERQEEEQSRECGKQIPYGNDRKKGIPFAQY
jgi:hypothetical protein